jgi:glycerol transport system ATP-binding protein
VQLGTPEELFARPAHTFVGYFIGSPGMNVLPARIEGSSAWLGGHEIPLGQRYGTVGGRTEIGCRPEFTSVAATGGLPVAIRRVEDVGRHKIVRADFEGREINSLLPEGRTIGPDETRIVLDPRATHVYADGRIVAGDEAGAGVGAL